MEYFSHSIPAGWKDGKVLGESLVRHSVLALATVTPLGVYLVGDIAVDASWSSLEGLLGGL
jgi:hypothetical protein